MRARLSSFGVAVLALAAPAVRAAPAAGPPVHLLLRGCAEISETEVERVLAAELGETAANDDATDPTFIVAVCSEGRVVIEVTDAVSRKTLKRSFDLSRSPLPARPRLIAIAASELVLASWAEVAFRPRLRVEPEGAAPTPERAQAAASRARRNDSESPANAAAEPALAAASDEDAEAEADSRARRRSWFALQAPDRRRFRVVPLASMRTFLDYGGRLWGGGLRIGEEPLVNASWAIDSLFESGTLETKSTPYSVDSWSFGAMMFLHTRVNVVGLRAGAGLRGGFVASNAPGAPATRTAIPWGWPLLAVNLTVGEHALVEVSAEGSYVVLPVTPTSVGVSVRGLWLALQVGIGISP